MRIKIKNIDLNRDDYGKKKWFRNIEIIELDVQNDIKIKDLNEQYHNKGGHGAIYISNGKRLRYDRTLSYYGIKDGDIIECYIAGGGDPYIKSPYTHICPNGCKRYIPDKYKDCDEWRNAEPYLFWYK